LVASGSVGGGVPHPGSRSFHERREIRPRKAPRSLSRARSGKSIVRTSVRLYGPFSATLSGWTFESKAAEGFELDEKPLNDKWVWAWHRGDDWRWPCYGEERHALEWMADRLRRKAIFE
jgi:hypothetical protein